MVESEGKETNTGQRTDSDVKPPTIQVDEAMRDFSVYVKLINATREYLKDVEVKATDGKWHNVPSVIPPNSNASFELNNTDWFTGSEGTLTYTVCDTDEKVRAKLSTCQEGPYISDNNVSLDTPDPQALYALSFRAKVDDGNWTDSYVEKRGHPVYVEYTLEYQRKRFRFSLISITATSAHAIRNSHKELIVGKHTLWSSLNPSIYPDGARGSFQPNVFAYQFNSPVPEVGILDVTVKPLDIELVGAEVLLFGIIDGKRVLQSDYFFFKSMAEVTVQAHVIFSSRSEVPFSWNADVDWGMELKLSNQGLDRFGPGTTRLELYWIATTVHRAFKEFLPIIFLRQVLKAHNVSPVSVVVSPAMTYSKFYADMTRRLFTDYNKIYDTISGASTFDMTYWGRNFQEDFYLHANGSGQPGTLYPYVNCMDQAAMLELSCSLLGGFSSTGRLAQHPFGDTKTTHLVGVAGGTCPININNPFFGTDQSRALVDINDLGRNPFSSHVDIGQSTPFVFASDTIYNACGGPHPGVETMESYISNSIDTGTSPGTVANIPSGVGVTGIDGQSALIDAARAESSMVNLPEPLSQLLGATLANNAGTVTHIDWAHVPRWLKAVLGDAWDIPFGQVTVGGTAAHAFWYLADADVSDSHIRVHVQVVSVIGQDGSLDISQSVDNARKCVRDILMSTIHDVWTMRTLPGLEESSLQYADSVNAGRIVVIARNVVIDIAGMSSSAALLPHALKLLNYTARRQPSTTPVPFVVPRLRRRLVRTMVGTVSATTLRGNEAEADIITIHGVDSHFSVVFTSDRMIITASAVCDGSGVLFDRQIIEEMEGEDGHAVSFLFVVREVGRHVVRVYVADSETMVTATQEIHVEVVDV